MRRPQERSPLSVGVVGLGAGSLAAYAAGHQWTFYEIDPAVARIARDSPRLHVPRIVRERCDVILGDARLSLEGSPTRYDLIVLDAFSSDAIPVHLLTEGDRVYLPRLRPGGLLAFHISNRHVDLRPALARIARDHQLVALAQIDPRGQGRPPGICVVRVDAHGAGSRGLRAAAARFHVDTCGSRYAAVMDGRFFEYLDRPALAPTYNFQSVTDVGDQARAAAHKETINLAQSSALRLQCDRPVFFPHQ